ncbi:MAG: choice-of-anchor Q domain-containing protein [Planctomycetota bacterium]
MTPGRFTLALILTVPALHAQTLFVDAGLTTGANDGSTWDDAFQGSDGLRRALAVVAADERIFVADGTYLPTTTGSIAESLVVPSRVALYGGFRGGEATPDERPAFGSAASILSGDLQGNDGPGFTGRADNSLHVVTIAGQATGVLLDGFVVRGGHAMGNYPDGDGGGVFGEGTVAELRDCLITDNQAAVGGGAAMEFASTTLTRCRFVGNQSSGSGGGLFLFFGACDAFGCRFEDNVSLSDGGAVVTSFITGLHAHDCVFWRNRASGAGGAIYASNGADCFLTGCTLVANQGALANACVVTSSVVHQAFVNCIVVRNGNGATAASQIFPPQNISYSIITGLAAGAGNLDLDPLFEDEANGDFRLRAGSPAIDAGTNQVTVVTTFDAGGARRRRDDPATPDTGPGAAPVVDIGAYESTTAFGTVFCAATPNSTGRAGELDAYGSAAVATNNLRLVASSLPPGTFGVLLLARSRAVQPLFAGSSGTLCLAAPFGRFSGPGQVQQASAAGELSLQPDLTASLPGLGALVAAGESWSFQAWHRDIGPTAPTSNFSDGVRVTFE